jgi:hypothetical protein
MVIRNGLPRIPIRERTMRRTAFVCIVLTLSAVGIVAPAVVNPQAHRAEANVYCDLWSGGVIARSGPYAAWVNPCVEFSTGGARAIVYVHCYTDSGDVPCNWEFRHLILERYLNGQTIVVKNRYAHQTGVANGYIAAPDSWYPCPVYPYNPAYHYSARSPDIYVRFPNGRLIGPRESRGGLSDYTYCGAPGAP